MRVEILDFAIYALYSIISTLLLAISNKNFTTPLFLRKLSVPLQAILGYKPSGLSKKMISETQFLYRRGSAKGNHFFIYEAFQL